MSGRLLRLALRRMPLGARSVKLQSVSVFRDSVSKIFKKSASDVKKKSRRKSRKSKLKRSRELRREICSAYTIIPSYSPASSLPAAAALPFLSSSRVTAVSEETIQLSQSEFM